ncbi:MAG: hypothetical protein KF819_01295 [Labilithrix sp.]|nr:hypothetical protein [Labilithrix sp.]
MPRRRLASWPGIAACAAGAAAAALAIAACEDRVGGDVMTRPGIYDGSPEPDDAVGPVVDGSPDTGASDAGEGGACPSGSTLRSVRAACTGAPLVPPAALVTDSTAAAPGDVVSLSGMSEPAAPCLPVVVCTPDDAPTLYFSDSPESPSQDGVLYADTAQPGRYRLYVYTTNGGAALRKFPVVVLNQGAAAAKVTIVRRGLAAPGGAYVAIGKQVIADWLAPRAPADVAVPPGTRVLLDADLDAMHASTGDLVHAIYDVVVDQPVKISFVSVLAGADAAAVTAGLPLLPRDFDHQRGTFPKADVLVTLAPVDGGAQKPGVQRLRLGLDEVDETLEGVDVPTGVKQKLLGNYGMLYRFALGLPSASTAAISARGGAWGGVVEIGDGGPIALPSASAALSTTTDAIVLGPQSPATTMRLMSAGGSNLPIDVFFVTP